MHLAHRALKSQRPAPVMDAETGVAVGPPGTLRAVLLPQQLQRHRLLLELLMDPREVWGGEARDARRGRALQSRRKLSLVKLAHHLPHHARRRGPLQILGYDTLRQVLGARDPLQRQPAFIPQTEQFLDPANGNSPARHPRSPKGSETTSPVSITFAAPPSQSTSSARLMPTISACSSKSVTGFLKSSVTIFLK